MTIIIEQILLPGLESIILWQIGCIEESWGRRLLITKNSHTLNSFCTVNSVERVGRDPLGFFLTLGRKKITKVWSKTEAYVWKQALFKKQGELLGALLSGCLRLGGEVGKWHVLDSRFQSQASWNRNNVGIHYTLQVAAA